MANCSKLHVSEEIVEQILSTLPPKSLMRFKCVCTLWCNLIKSPSFVAKHLRASSSVSIFFKHAVENDDLIREGYDGDILLSSLNICNGNDDDVVAEVVRVPHPMNQIRLSSDLRLAGHCDGITCLKLFCGNAVLCNPAIKEFKLLPKSCKLLPIEDWHLVFNLEYYADYLGFGYDCKAKDYKVVRFVVFDESGYEFKAEVYTLGSNSWREIETKYTHRSQFVIREQYSDPKYFEGICYWQVVGTDGEFILSFHMSDEIFNQILVPWEDMPDGYRWRLGVWKESIALITYPVVSEVPHSFNIWVKMNDSGDVKDSWTKCFTTGPTEGVELPLLRPLVFWKSEKLLMVTNDGRAVSYNLGTKTIKYLPIHFVGHFRLIQAVVCTNSIVSVEGGNKLEGIDNSAFYGINTLADGRLEALCQI